jgi:hypothetical protein
VKGGIFLLDREELYLNWFNVKYRELLNGNGRGKEEEGEVEE